MPRQRTIAYRYDAFLSYAHADGANVAWLERELMRTWVPGKKKPILYRDLNRLDAGFLTEKLREALRESRFLIVCCSPAAAASTWVNREIETFAELHAQDGVHASRSILACRVAAGNAAAILPAALASVCQPIDDLYVPDVSRGEEATPHERRGARREVCALLAPLLDLPDRDAVFARARKRTVLYGCLASLLLAVSATLWAWTRTDRYQIMTIATASADLIGSAGESSFASDWLETLAASEEWRHAAKQARALPDEEFRALALTAVARGLARAGHKCEAVAVAHEAKAADIRSDRYKTLALAAVAKAFADSGDMAAANAGASEAWKAAAGIQVAQMRKDALSEAADALFAARNPSAAASAGLGMADAARVENDEAARAVGLANAAAHLQRAHHAAAADVAAEAMAASRKIKADRWQVDALVRMSESWASAGLTEEARSAASQALELSKGLNGALRTLMLTARVMPALQRVELVAQFVEALHIASASLDAIENPDERARAIAYVVPWVARLRGEQEAIRLARSGVEVMRVIEDPDRRIDVLAEFSHQLAKAHLEMTFELSRKATDLAPAHTQDRGRCVAFVHISAAYAELGSLRLSRLAAERCALSTDRLQAYHTILQHHIDAIAGSSFGTRLVAGKNSPQR